MKLNQRQKVKGYLLLSLLFLVTVAVAGGICHEEAMVTDFSRKNIPPCLQYPFGTDWLGRNMFYRTLTGLSMSILIGVSAAGVSAAMAMVLGIASATLGKKNGFRHYIFHRYDHGNSAYSSSAFDFLCYGEGTEGCDRGRGPYALDFPCPADQRRGAAA